MWFLDSICCIQPRLYKYMAVCFGSMRRRIFFFRTKFCFAMSTWHVSTYMSYVESQCYAGFRLTCRLPHCRFDDDICSTAQAPLAAAGWPSGKQRQANRSITLPLCPPRQIADSWILFNSGAMPLGDKAKAALPRRAATLKQQAMITRHSGKAASGKLVWNQHYSIFLMNLIFWFFIQLTQVSVFFAMAKYSKLTFKSLKTANFSCTFSIYHMVLSCHCTWSWKWIICNFQLICPIIFHVFWH